MSLFLSEGAGQDVVVMMHGDRLPAAPAPALRATGWVGGLWVRLVNPIDVNDWLVIRSNGIVASGFLLMPSENQSATDGEAAYRNFTSIQPANSNRTTLASGASTTTVVLGNGRFLFRVFETVALTVGGIRAGGPAVYSLNDDLKVSENGLLCNDPDANLLAATGGTSTIRVGFCSAVPNARSGNRLGLDLQF